MVVKCYLLEDIIWRKIYCPKLDGKQGGYWSISWIYVIKTWDATLDILGPYWKRMIHNKIKNFKGDYSTFPISHFFITKYMANI